jgi:hypothetical protein
MKELKQLLLTEQKLWSIEMLKQSEHLSFDHILCITFEIVASRSFART